MRTDLLGIVFSNAADEMLREMTGVRCLGSVPFGGRYRLIDFALSNLVNAGVSKVAVITKSNYRSLIDHLGSGKPWDLARKKGGLSIFPPFINYGDTVRTSRVEQLLTILPLLEMSTQEYAVLCDCDVVSSIDIEAVAKKHCDTGADITIVYKHGKLPMSLEGRMVLGMDKDMRINEIRCQPDVGDDCDFSLNIAVMKRELLIRMIKDAKERSLSKIARDVLQPGIKELKLYGYRAQSYVGVIDSMQSYLSVSAELLQSEVRRELFYTGRTVYTKVRDEMPVRYGLNSAAENCLIADGCVIDGSITNCILFRGVKIHAGASLKNCVIMQGSDIAENTSLEYVICDKNVKINPGRTLTGYKTYPAFIEKNSVI